MEEVIRLRVRSVRGNFIAIARNDVTVCSDRTWSEFSIQSIQSVQSQLKDVIRCECAQSGANQCVMRESKMFQLEQKICTVHRVLASLQLMSVQLVRLAVWGE